MKILITGAGSGIGRSAALALGKRNHTVLATTHTQESADILKKEAIANNISLEVMKIDITQEDDRKKGIAFFPDILINNAGMGQSGPLAEIPLAYVKNVMETNVFSTLALTQPIAQHMVKQGFGRIITITSVAGRFTLPYLGPYSMTKYALESMSDALRRELAPHHVFVSIIEPGAFATGFNERMNRTKYQWFSKKSFFGKDMDRIKKSERLIEDKQPDIAVIISAIIHAVEAKKPKIRYVVPHTIAPLLILSKILPDSLMDWIMQKRIG